MKAQQQSRASRIFLMFIAVNGRCYPKKHSFNIKYNKNGRQKKAENEHFDPLSDHFDDPGGKANGLFLSQKQTDCIFFFTNTK